MIRMRKQKQKDIWWMNPSQPRENKNMNWRVFLVKEKKNPMTVKVIKIKQSLYKICMVECKLFWIVLPKTIKGNQKKQLIADKILIRIVLLKKIKGNKKKLIAVKIPT